MNSGYLVRETKQITAPDIKMKGTQEGEKGIDKRTMQRQNTKNYKSVCKRHTKAPEIHPTTTLTSPLVYFG